MILITRVSNATRIIRIGNARVHRRINNASCKTYWFQFTRSTMSPKCAKPKTEYSAYVTKPAPIYRKPKYQKQMHDYGKIKYNRYSNRKYYYVPRKLYTPRKMTTILYKRY